MVAQAQGKGQSSGMQPLVARLVGARQLVLLVHAPLAALVEQSMRVIDHLTPLDPRSSAAVHRLLPAAGRDVPVSAWVTRQSADQLGIDVRVSADLVGVGARALVAALQGLGLGGSIGGP